MDDLYSIIGKQRAISQRQFVKLDALIPTVSAWYRVLFFTASIKNCTRDLLFQEIANIEEGFAKLVKELPFLRGYLRSLEVTYSSEKGFHPHIHCLLAVDKSYFGTSYLSNQQWQTLWRTSLEVNYNPIVDVRAVKMDDISSMVYEMTKPNLRFDPTLNKEWLDLILEHWFRIRTVHANGCFK